MRAVVPVVVLLAGSLAVAGCDPFAGGGERGAAQRGVVHLADQLAEASLRECGEPPAGTRERRSWDLASAAGEWRPLGTAERKELATLAVEPIGDGVRLSFARPAEQRGPLFIGGLQIDLAAAGLDVRDWDTVRVRARTRQRFAGLAVAYNLDEPGAVPGPMAFFYSTGDVPPIFNDGSVQTYAMPLVPREGDGHSRRLTSLAVVAGSPGPAALDVLAVELVARGAGFVEPCGVRAVTRSGETRTALFAHAPSKLGFRVDVPAGGRLDTGLTVLPGDTATVRVSAAPAGAGGDAKLLLEEKVADGTAWLQRSVDLAAYAGRSIDLTFEVTGDRAGDAALLGAPIVAAAAPPGAAGAPNIVFYVIDGGGADLMSLYGYNRRTTPFLEELAGEGVVFERAFSNATWTQPSTASFMTSLQHSVLGGLRRGVHSTPVPAKARTLIERLREAGYQTASFTANPNAGRMIGIERGVDRMRDLEEGGHSTSSARLHEQFWRFRDEYPGGPWFVHFQTTDVHEPNEPTPPYSGLYVSPGERHQLEEMDNRIWQAAAPLFGTMSIVDFYDRAIAQSGVDRQAYFNIRRGLYDETMAYQDAELAKFVRRLQARGEWENTILVVGADHGHPAGTFARFGRGLFEPQPDPWEGALFDSYATRVPLVFVWGRGIEGGRRIEAPVSMIDVMPTLLDLAGLPRPEVAQGQSLATALRGGEQEFRPVILDEFRVDEASGEMIGNLEIVDGRWGASLEIGPQPGAADPARGRHMIPVGGRWGALHRYFPDAPRLLLYDLWADPFATKAVNDRHPELVERYTRELVAHWKANQALAQRYLEAGEVTLDPEQLRQLKALGYIQ